MSDRRRIALLSSIAIASVSAAIAGSACGNGNASPLGFASRDGDGSSGGDVDAGSVDGSFGQMNIGETTGGTTGDDGGLAIGTGGTGSTTDASDGCSDAARLVYVVDDANVLHSFEPSKLAFATIGTLHCPSRSTPASMAVSRSGVAWVTFLDGTLYNVSITDASCTATAFVPKQANLDSTFGMGFASNGDGGADETLFVIGSNGSNGGHGLGTIDTTTLVATRIGDFTDGLAGNAGELTGTGDGRLYGFIETSPNASLAAIDKSTAATPSPMSLPGLNITDDAFAFSFWGGDFWFYTAGSSDSSSSVTQLKASSDNSLAVVRREIGFTIVGAGVSTCAPTVPAPIR